MRRIITQSLVVVVIACTVWGCSGDNDPPHVTFGTPGGSAPPPPAPGGSFSISGTVTYDFVPVLATGGLDHANTEQRPVRNAAIQVVDTAGGAVLANGTTSATGAYSLTYSGASLVAVRVMARTTSPGPIDVQDNTAGNALYSVQSATVAAGTPSLNFTAGSGFDTTSNTYTSARAAAPFAILDTIQVAAESFSAIASLSFPTLAVNWSVNNVPQSGSVSAGQIGTTFYSANTGQIFVLGDANVDTDEFDRHVLVHEWGHYYEHRFSRQDSLGGAHGADDVLDPRVAMSEGFANALSAMILFPDVTYKDTSGAGQATTGVSYSLESGSATTTPGWYNEASVGQIVYDLQDTAPDVTDGDNIAIGLSGIHAVMTDARYRGSSELTTLFSFITTAKLRFAGQETAIDALTSAESIQPIADNLGTGESNDGGLAANLPVYRAVTIGGGATVLNMRGKQSSPGVARSNVLQQNRYLRFTGNGAAVTITSASAADVDLELYENGVSVATETGATGNETINRTTTNGTIYVLAVQGYNAVEGNDYTCTITIN